MEPDYNDYDGSHMNMHLRQTAPPPVADPAPTRLELAERALDLLLMAVPLRMLAAKNPGPEWAIVNQAIDEWQEAKRQ